MIILLIFLPALCLTQPTLSSTFDWTIKLTVYGKRHLGKTCACARGVRGLSHIPADSVRELGQARKGYPSRYIIIPYHRVVTE